MSSIHHSASEDLLNSWKEIAAYLHRGVRTVQRWEVNLGLPVRRPAGKTRSAVIAMRSELDQWVKSSASGRPDGLAPAGGRASYTQVLLNPASLSTKKSIEQCQALRAQLRQARRELAQAVERYVLTVRSLKLPYIGAAPGKEELQKDCGATRRIRNAAA